jgi:hypothetical protein
LSYCSSSNFSLLWPSWMCYLPCSQLPLFVNCWFFLQSVLNSQFSEQCDQTAWYTLRFRNIVCMQIFLLFTTAVPVTGLWEIFPQHLCFICLDTFVVMIAFLWSLLFIYALTAAFSQKPTKCILLFPQCSSLPLLAKCVYSFLYRS